MTQAATRKGYTDHKSGWITRDDGAVEAVRFYQSQEAMFSGWIVRSVWNPMNSSDAIANKAEAIECLLAWDTSE